MGKSIPKALEIFTILILSASVKSGLETSASQTIVIEPSEWFTVENICDSFSLTNPLVPFRNDFTLFIGSKVKENVITDYSEHVQKLMEHQKVVEMYQKALEEEIKKSKVDLDNEQIKFISQKLYTGLGKIYEEIKAQNDNTENPYTALISTDNLKWYNLFMRLKKEEFVISKLFTELKAYILDAGRMKDEENSNFIKKSLTNLVCTDIINTLGNVFHYCSISDCSAETSAVIFFNMFINLDFEGYVCNSEMEGKAASQVLKELFYTKIFGRQIDFNRDYGIFLESISKDINSEDEKLKKFIIFDNNFFY